MQSDDLGLAAKLLELISSDDHERLCQGREYSCSCGYDERKDAALREAAAAIERLVAERDEAFEISAKIADACRADIERNPHDFGPLDQGGIRASEKIAAAIRARQALKDAP